VFSGKCKYRCRVVYTHFQVKDNSGVAGLVLFFCFLFVGFIWFFGVCMCVFIYIYISLGPVLCVYIMFPIMLRPLGCQRVHRSQHTKKGYSYEGKQRRQTIKLNT